ncbi:MAG: ring-1,2-phenylacetyl-CoA epoxidase subunit PaaD [Motiliproteus sp.]|jgi:ring-1,2-phenylacetyl-CoA epoxidase subunit PaaD
MNQISLMPKEQHDRLLQRQQANVEQLWIILDAVTDPEIPALSLWDLGVLRDVCREGETIRVTITPTYSGCPAMDAMRTDIAAALAEAGFAQIKIDTQLAPAWTTDWMSSKGREKLRNYGIAPPEESDSDDYSTPEADITCPHCGSQNSRRISEFGSTACKALFQCNECSEPFDYFKRI